MCGKSDDSKIPGIIVALQFLDLRHGMKCVLLCMQYFHQYLLQK